MGGADRKGAVCQNFPGSRRTGSGRMVTCLSHCHLVAMRLRSFPLVRTWRCFCEAAFLQIMKTKHLRMVQQAELTCLAEELGLECTQVGIKPKRSSKGNMSSVAS